MKKLTFLFLIFFAAYGWAHPTNHVVIDGHADFNFTDAQTLQIKSMDKTVIHWDDFSIGLNEVVKFLQNSRYDTVLNHVTGKHLSSILGRLEADGRVLLVNPNGIHIGKDAVINAGSFTASTLDLLLDDFLQNGDLHFQGDSSKNITNYGTIHALHGDVTILSRQVVNHGNVQAPNGHVTVGCGQEILLKPESEKRIFIRAHETDQKGEVGIQNLGKISAIQVDLQADGNPYTYAIKHEGEIDALGIVNEGGHVRLIAEDGVAVVSGKIKASTAEGIGGTVHLLGRQVALTEQAEIDVSGKNEGGTFLCGGDFQGSNPNIYNSEITYVEKGAFVKANALENGDGGKAIFWSDGNTYVYGVADVRGGENKGDGGLIEVSGKLGFEFGGDTLRSAPYGQPGTLLLDPDSDITITTGTLAPTGGAFAAGTFFPTATPSTIQVGPGDPGTLFSQLALGPVVVQTNCPLCGAGGSITVFSGLGRSGGLGATGTYTSDFDLTLTTPGNITVNGVLRNRGGGNINVTAGGNLRVEPTSPLFGNPAILGAKSGLLRVISVDGDLTVQGGLTGNINAYAQIGYDADDSSGNMQFDFIGGDVLVQGGSSTRTSAHIGHGVEDDAGVTLSGNITFTTVGGDFTLNGGTGIDSFAQMGHSTSAGTRQEDGTMTGNITVTNLGGDLALTADTASGTFALIGHGGLNPSSGIAANYTTNIFIGSSNSISLTAGQATTSGPQTFAVIGLAQETLTALTYNPSTVTLNTNGNVTVTAGRTSNAIIGSLVSTTLGPLTGPQTGTFDLITVNAGNDINVVGYPNPFTFAATEAVIGVSRDPGGDPIRSFTANLNINAGNTINITGGAAPGFFFFPGSGAILRSGSFNSSFFIPPLPAPPPAFINATAQQNFNMTAMGGTAGIFASGVLNARSVNADFNMTPSADASVFITGYDVTTIRAGVNMNLNQGNGLANIASITTFGAQLSLVVDDLFPVSPLIGPGRYFQAIDATVATNGAVNPPRPPAPLRIFTALQPLNTIDGTLNGLPFNAGTQYVDTLQERWGIYFFDPFNGFDFTVFYKDSPLILIASAAQGLVATAEIFRDLHPYDEFIRWYLEFNNSYETVKGPPSDGSLSSYDVLGETFNFIRRRNYRDNNVLIHNSLKHF